MNINIKVSLTDIERNRMYRNITGKCVKKMISRSELNDFVAGCIDAAISEIARKEHDDPSAPSVPMVDRFTPSELAEVTRLQAAGKSDNYIHGQLQVIRRYVLS